MSEARAFELEQPSGNPLAVVWDFDRLAGAGPDAAAVPWRLDGPVEWDSVEEIRILFGRLEDGRTLAVAALRPAGTAGHDEDSVAGLLADASGERQLEEVLLSTELGPDGEPRRIGLELLAPGAEVPLRVAGDVTAPAADGAAGRRRYTLELRCGGARGAGTLERLSG